MDKAQKQAETDSLVERFKGAQVAVCVDYLGLTVGEVTELRGELRKANSQARVVKNTLTKLAVGKFTQEAENDKDEVGRFLDIITGPTMVVTCDEDPIAPTKVLAKFAKTNKKFRVKGCWLDGAFVDPAGVESLALMPGREETFAMLLSLMNEPATRMVRLLSEPGTQVARCVEAYRKKLGGEESAAA